MTRSLLVGGPFSGQYLDMPENSMVHKVPRDNGSPVTYTRLRVSNDGKETEVWGWAPLCYRVVKARYLKLIEP